MRVTFATNPGGPGENEDWCIAAPDLAIVLDGLSAPGGDTGCKHGTPWYVRQLGGRLVTHLADPHTSLPDALATAIGDVSDQHRQTCDLSHPGTPSSTVAAVRESGNGDLQYLALADSVILLDTTAGIQVLTDNRVDHALVEEQEATFQEPIDSPAHRELLRKLVKAQRDFRNTPQGYWVASTDPQAAREAITGSVPLAELRRAAVLSDGVTRLVDQYFRDTWAGLLDLLEEAGPAGLIRRVRRADAQDPEGRGIGHYKRSDDATVIWISW